MPAMADFGSLAVGLTTSFNVWKYVHFKTKFPTAGAGPVHGIAQGRFRPEKPSLHLGALVARVHQAQLRVGTEGDGIFIAIRRAIAKPPVLGPDRKYLQVEPFPVVQFERLGERRGASYLDIGNWLTLAYLLLTNKKDCRRGMRGGAATF
jgi:hypothetical protein